MTFEVDVRIPRAELDVAPGHVLRLEHLTRIDLHPPASGPEVELTLGPFDVGAGSQAEAIVGRELNEAALTVLAIRHRADGWQRRR